MLRSYPKKSTGRGTEWNEENENYVVLRKPLGKKHLFRGLLNWLPSHGSLQSCVILHQGNSALLGTPGSVRRHTWVSQLGTCYWHGQRPRTLLHGLQCIWEPPQTKEPFGPKLTPVLGLVCSCAPGGVPALCPHASVTLIPGLQPLLQASLLAWVSEDSTNQASEWSPSLNPLKNKANFGFPLDNHGPQLFLKGVT